MQAIFDRINSLLDSLTIDADGNVAQTDHNDSVKSEVSTLYMELMRRDELNSVACFSLAVSGSAEGGVRDEDDLHDVETIFRRSAGPLGNNVFDYLRDASVPLYSIMLGEGEWSLTYFLTPGQAWLTYQALLGRFNKSVESGVLALDIFPAAPRPAEKD